MEDLCSVRGIYNSNPEQSRFHRYPPELLAASGEIIASSRFRRILNQQLAELCDQVFTEDLALRSIPHFWSHRIAGSLLQNYAPPEHQTPHLLPEVYKYLRGQQPGVNTGTLHRFMQSIPRGLLPVIAEYGIIDSFGRAAGDISAGVAKLAIYGSSSPQQLQDSIRTSAVVNQYAGQYRADDELGDPEALQQIVKSTLRRPVNPSLDGSDLQHPDTFVRISQQHDRRMVFICLARTEVTAALHSFAAGMALRIQNFDHWIDFVNEDNLVQSNAQIWSAYADIIEGC